MTPAASKAAKAAILKKIKSHTVAIGKHRDALREIESDLRDIVESTDEGMRELEDAIDKISQYL